MTGLDSVRARIARAAESVGRPPESVTLVVVTKERPVEEIGALYSQGQKHFGENRAQELAAKVDRLPSDITWHFIGPLQTNKVRIVRPIVGMLHSLDRPELGPAWVKGPGSPPPVLVQVRIGGEVQKHGVDPGQAVGLCLKARALGIEVKGLMAIPPQVAAPEEAAPYFRQLAEIGAEVTQLIPDASELSMGMTDDFEVAVAAGATIVRVGRAIFGPVPN